MLRDGLYSAYTWRVRHFREGETNETLVRFTPDGRPYGFVETLKEDAPGAALDAADARRRAEADAPARWNVDLTPFALVEQGQETASRRPRRSHDDLRAIVAGPRRGPLPAPARGLRRPADRSHPLRPDSRSVHPPLRQHAIGQRGDRHRLARRHGAALRRRRHRRRPLLHAPEPLRPLAPGGRVGPGGRLDAGARRPSTSGR